MIIIERNNVAKSTKKAMINRNVLLDLNRKKKQIEFLALKTIQMYKIMCSKCEKGLDLTSDERFLKQRSTLINFKDWI